MKKIIRQIFPIAAVLIFAGIYSCANMGTPTGGPKDETPPVFVRSNPAPGALDYTKAKVEIFFDENIALEKPGEKIVISPPQKNMPTIKTSGKKVTVEVKDTLQPNTTYTIDFSDAVVDNNEKNPYPNFSFSFSTGDVIDSLLVSGMALNARNLEPVNNMLIGLHKNLNDSAFITDPFYRISRTDAYGKFSVKSLAEGKYKIYALNDLNRDYKFDQSGEDIAFCDSLIIPHFELRLKHDTVWKDTATVDTVLVREYNHFLPDDILLMLFKEKTTKNQFLQKQERTSENKFSLYFNAPSEILPTLKPLNFRADDWYILEKNQTNDTLHYWIRDPEVLKTDTLLLQLDYLKTNADKELVSFSDTLSIMQKAVRSNVSKKKKDESGKDPEPVYFKPNVNLSKVLEIYMPVRIEWEAPVATLDKDGLHLEIKSDTIWKPFPFTYESDTAANIRTFKLAAKWTPDSEYRFQIDSASVTSIYGTHNDEYSQIFKVKRLEDYGFIYFNLTNVDTPAFVELLDKSDNIVRKSPVKDATAEFLFLPPETYYARIVLDTNNNGVWDTGDYRKKIQSETVCYYNQGIQLLANFEISQDWDIKALPVTEQKPKELIKNKPKEKPTTQNTQ